MAMKFGRGGVLVAMVAATAVVWWFVRPSAKPIDSVSRRANATNSSVPELPAPQTAGEAARHEEERPAGEATPSPKSDDSSDPVIRWIRDPEAGIAVEGTVTVVDAHDEEHPHEDGSFRPIAWRGDGGNGGKAVAIAAGRFQTHFPPGCDLVLGALDLGGRSAIVTNGRGQSASGSGDVPAGNMNRFQVVPGQPIRVTAQWPRPFILHVVEAGRGSELREVDAFLVRNRGMTGDAVNPGSLTSAEKLVEHGVSPLELAGPRSKSKIQWQDSVWVHAPGCTWCRTRVDFEKGGESRLELSPGADLEVAIAGTIPPPPATQHLSYETDESLAVLRLRDEAAVKLLLERAPDPHGPTRVEGLPPGRTVLSLERGTWWDNPLVLARTSVELTAGSTTHATLTIVKSDEAHRVPLSGTLHLADEWDCTWLDLRFEPANVKGGTSLEKRGLELKDLERTGTPGLYRFKLEPVLPGRYVVKSYAFSYQQIVDTGPEGRTDLALVIGDPADVAVHVLDAFTEKPYDEEKLLLWNCRWPPESTGGGLMWTKWDADHCAYLIKAPAGEIELHVDYESPGRFEPLEPRYFTVRPGGNELTIRVRRSTGVLLTFEQEGRPVHRPSDVTIHVESADGTKLDAASNPDLLKPIGREDGLLQRVPSGGAWRITFDPPAGFEPIAPLDVTLTTGELTARTVELHPAR
jgi:hypothetical protein